ncbi:MAG: carbohydrate ABC transporter permease [Chloroflexi bacterium]|nr:carbohydrate ABC transporter permease [Chloroflexota bacterium]
MTTAIKPIHAATYQIRKALKNTVTYGVLVALVFFFAFPIVFMLVSSFKADNLQLLRDFSSLKSFVPYGELGLDNYAKVFERLPLFPRYFLNSMLIVGLTVCFNLLFDSMLAYALARLRWKGRNLVLTVIVALIIVPFQAIAIPLLLLVNWFGWLDSYQVQIVPFLVTPLYVFLFYQFFVGLPKDFDEAAIIDGAGYPAIYWRIIMPLSRPVVATVTILNFLGGWGSYLWPLMTIHDPEYFPLMVGMGFFIGQTPQIPGQLLAFSSMVSIPILIVFALFQKSFIQSVAASGIKG